MEYRKGIKFFQEHAGYCTPPGRMACAKSLAIAEQAANVAEAQFEWRQEEFERIEDLLDSSMFRSENEFKRYCDKYRDDVLCCILRDANGDVLASLGGIIGADKDYRRVVEAELALEAFSREFFIH
jgi:hypothetical protein